MRSSVVFLMVLLLGLSGAAPASAAQPVPVLTGRPRLDVEIFTLLEARTKLLYQTQDVAEQETGLRRLAMTMEGLVPYYPELAEPRLMAAQLWLDVAEIRDAQSDRELYQRALTGLQEAERLDQLAMQGKVYQLLGRLYAQAPGGWFGIGDAEKAQAYLEHALRIQPGRRETYLHYGLACLENGEYARAIAFLEHGLGLPKRKQQKTAEAGLDKAFRAMLAQARAKQGIEEGGAGAPASDAMAKDAGT